MVRSWRCCKMVQFSTDHSFRTNHNSLLHLLRWQQPSPSMTKYKYGCVCWAIVIMEKAVRCSNRAALIGVRVSLAALAVGLHAQAYAQCSPDPSQANTAITCTCSDTNGVVVSTTASSLTVASRYAARSASITINGAVAARGLPVYNWIRVPPLATAPTFMVPPPPLPLRKAPACRAAPASALCPAAASRRSLPRCMSRWTTPAPLAAPAGRRWRATAPITPSLPPSPTGPVARLAPLRASMDRSAMQGCLWRHAGRH
jgi:hypothetical protein